MTDQLISLRAAAERLGVSERTVRRHLCGDHGVRVERIGRRRLVHEADVAVWLHRQRLEPTPEIIKPMLADFSGTARELLEAVLLHPERTRKPGTSATAGDDSLTLTQKTEGLK